MFAIVLAIGVLNLGLGFALAVFMELPIAWPRVTLPRLRRASKSGPDVAGQTVPTPPTKSNEINVEIDSLPEQVVSHATALVAESTAPEMRRNVDGSWLSSFPSQWVTLLETNRVTPESFTEAMLWVVRLELPMYRQILVSVDQSCRANGSEPFPKEDFKKACDDWIGQVTAWMSALRDQPELPDETGLREALLDQMAQLQVTAEIICGSSTAPGMPEEGGPNLKGLGAILKSTDELRDRVDELLSGVLGLDGRWNESNDELRTDGLSGTMSRIGLESFAQDWLKRDADRVRVMSGALVDIDQCTALNDQQGVQTTDKVITALGGLLLDLVRKDRGCDRICRIGGGGGYFIIFGDTGLRNATNCVERIRQSIESTRFQVGQNVVTIAVSCAVCEWHRAESLLMWLDRLGNLLGEAKHSGRNRTCVGDENGSRIIASGPLSVRAREISLS